MKYVVGKMIDEVWLVSSKYEHEDHIDYGLINTETGIRGAKRVIKNPL